MKKLNVRKKGALIIRGLLRNLAFNEALYYTLNPKPETSKAEL